MQFGLLGTIWPMDECFLSIPYALFAQETLEVAGIVGVADDKVKAFTDLLLVRRPCVFSPRSVDWDEAKPMSADITLQDA